MEWKSWRLRSRWSLWTDSLMFSLLFFTCNCFFLLFSLLDWIIDKLNNKFWIWYIKILTIYVNTKDTFLCLIKKREAIQRLLQIFLKNTLLKIYYLSCLMNLHKLPSLHLIHLLSPLSSSSSWSSSLASMKFFSQEELLMTWMLLQLKRSVLLKLPSP